MRIGLLASNLTTITDQTERGIETFVHLFTKNLAEKSESQDLKITAFASGNSQLPVPIVSLFQTASADDPDIGRTYYPMFELPLLSKAFQMQDQFDLYHAHLGNSENVLAFAPFVNKPILITLHTVLDLDYEKKYLSLFKDLKNVFYISISNNQRKPLPNLNYVKTIYHGIDTEKYKYSENGGDTIFWMGRATTEKGFDIALPLINKVGKKSIIVPAFRPKFEDWAKSIISQYPNLAITYKATKEEIVNFYQRSRLYLFPIQWEEPFGLVMAESMACGTPIVAFARGSVPEIIKDGETGFIVNSSEQDIRGNWIIKKTGIAGLEEAINRIYSMSDQDYKKMRTACRNHVEKNFSVDRMVDEYISIYKQLTGL